MRFIFLLFGLGISMGITAQPTYKQSAGVRLGHTSGMTFKKFVAKEEAIDFILSGRNEGLHLTTMYVFHTPMQFSFNENFYAYYGVGGHVGFERFNDLEKRISPVSVIGFQFENKGYYTMGIDAIIGLEYRWLTVPVTIGFDIKPYYNFIGMRFSRAHFWDSAISFKYVF